MKAIASFALAFLFLLTSNIAHAVFGTPYITPDHPIAGQTISMNIYQGGCDAILGIPGYPQISQTGNAIRILFNGVRYTDPELCDLGFGTARYAVAAYPAGSYTLQVDLRYPNVGGDFVVETLGIVPFSVAAPAAPFSAPATTSGGLALLMSLLVLAALMAFRARRPDVFLILILIVPLGGHAQSAPADGLIELLLTTDAGAPTPAQLVDYYRKPTGSFPLASLAAMPPLAVSYLASNRASGEFLLNLQQNPTSARAKLERMVLLRYAPETDKAPILNALHADVLVESASPPVRMEGSSVGLGGFSVVGTEPYGSVDQYGRDTLNINAAWQIAGGYALIADIDTGLYTAHPALEQFSGNTYIGGNYVPAASRDVGGTGLGIADDPNPDELRPAHVSDTNCNPNNLPLQSPVAAGHGTHVAGLIGASGGSIGVLGICKHCGIAMWKFTYVTCNAATGEVIPATNGAAQAAALMTVADQGAQVVNMSFGGNQNYTNFCLSNPGAAMCLAITHAAAHEVLMVASSGNARMKLNFPAMDARVVSAGGFQQNLAIWDDSPSSCPAGASECGSNYTVAPASGPYQELSSSAKEVWSTTYPNHNWNSFGCGDKYPGPGFGGGVGLCTGTSMSAPQVSGVAGILRSINPLVSSGSVGTPTAGVRSGIRGVMAQTTVQALALQAWDPKLGYGFPDAAAAAKKLIGVVEKRTVLNRATPLFRLYNATTHDYADTTSPQYAVGLMVAQTSTWQPPAALATKAVFGYPSFPHTATETVGTPLASVYVLTTEVKPRTEWPDLIPLYLMDKDYASGKDYLLATTKAEVEAAYLGPDNIHCNNGHLDNSTTPCSGDDYDLRTIQGYIYKPCTPESSCIPPGARPLWRQYNVADNDCAVFLDTEKPAFEAAQYTAACPTGSTKMIGYAYPETDTDGDGLPDGFEYVIGTSPTRADSDGDGVNDGVEFPLAGVPLTDPCDGGTNGLYCGADVIFRNGFE